MMFWSEGCVCVAAQPRHKRWEDTLSHRQTGAANQLPWIPTTPQLPPTTTANHPNPPVVGHGQLQQGPGRGEHAREVVEHGQGHKVIEAAGACVATTTNNFNERGTALHTL